MLSGRLSAGVGLGMLFSAYLTGLAAWSWPGPWQDVLLPSLLLFYPLWMGLVCASLCCASARRAWTVLGTGSVLAGLALVLLKQLQWVS